MSKYWIIPVLYFIFGALVFAAESLVFGAISEVSIEVRKLTNYFNKGLFILAPIILGFFIVLPGVHNLKTLSYKVVFVVYSVILYVLISHYWITTIVWK